MLILIIWECIFRISSYMNFTIFKLNLLGWHGLIKPYRFHVYHSITYHLHTAPCTCYLKWLSATTCTHFDLFYPSTPPPCFIWQSPNCCSYLCVFSLLLKALYLFYSVPWVLSSDKCQSVPCIHASVSIWSVSLFCSLGSRVYISEIIWHLTFSNWLFLLSIIFSRSIHVTAKRKICFFFMTE